MKPPLKSSRAARDLIKVHEPFRATATLQGKRWVVGYGHTAGAREGLSISAEDADLLLVYDLMKAEEAVNVTLGEQLPAKVRDALVSFAASVGPAAFRVSDVARLTRAGRYLEAAAAIETWVRAEQDGRLVVSERLTRRRAAEKALFLAGLAPQTVPVVSVSAEPQAVSTPQPAEVKSEAASTLPSSAPPASAVRADRPRLGPLVDLEIEFEDPPESGTEPVAARVAEPAQTEADAELLAAEAIAPDEASSAPLETAEGVGEAASDNTVADADAPVTESAEPAEAPERSVAASDSTPSLHPNDAKRAQNAVVDSVMARMARQIAESVESSAEVTPQDEPAADENEPVPDPQQAPTAAVQLGYSYLEPLNEAVQSVMGEPRPDAQRDVSTDPGTDAPLVSPTVSSPDGADAPVPVYGAIATADIAPAAPAPAGGVDVEVPPPHPMEAPASGSGLSGEVGGVNRPIDMEEPETHDDEELHPGVVRGVDIDTFNEDERASTQHSSGGGWIYTVILIAGIALTCIGAGYLIYQMLTPGVSGLFQAGPVSLAMGLVLIIASISFLAAHRKAQRSSSALVEDTRPDGYSGEV